MKIMLGLMLFMMVASVASNEVELSKPPVPTVNKRENNINKIKGDDIEVIARKIFNDKMDIYDFIDIDCRQSNDNEKGVWGCYIRQTATKFENGKYTVNPPGVGNWLLVINFNKNEYYFDNNLISL